MWEKRGKQEKEAKEEKKSKPKGTISQRRRHKQSVFLGVGISLHVHVAICRYILRRVYGDVYLCVANLRQYQNQVFTILRAQL